MRWVLLTVILAVARPSTAQVRTPGEQANVELVSAYSRTCLDQFDIDCVARYIADDFIQHSPALQPSGKASLLAHFAEPFARLRQAKPAVKTIYVGADGDIVTLIRSLPIAEPGEPGKTYEGFIVDVFRVREGKLVEHWDGGRKAAAAPKE